MTWMLPSLVEVERGLLLTQYLLKDRESFPALRVVCKNPVLLRNRLFSNQPSIPFFRPGIN